MYTTLKLNLDGGTVMNKQKAWFWMVVRLSLVLLGALLLAGCGAGGEVGALQTESQSVELGDAEAVRVEIIFGAGDLDLAGGAQKLLEADFTYNVARLKPEVEYTDDTLVVRQPEVKGLPSLNNLTDFRNEWGLRLSNEVPMDLSVIVGGGISDLQLAGLPLTRLDIDLGAGISTIDLSGNWTRDLDVTIESGAAEITVRLPREIGARVEVDAGPTAIEATGLRREGNVYTNDAYGMSEVTLQVKMDAGIGMIHLEVEEDRTAEAQ
jgi:hypothetical protein